jgi:hypothetical protein
MNEQQFEQFTNFIDITLNETMTLDDYEVVMESLDVPNPTKNTKEWMYKSMCHNIDLSHAKNNLAFYPNTRSYYCWSECQVSFNLITLLEQRFKIIDEPKSRFQCMKYICDVCDIPFNFADNSQPIKKKEYDWKKTLLKYLPNQTVVEEDVILDNSILDMFPRLYSDTWIDDNISIEVMEKYGIRFYPYAQCVIVPCRNIDGKLIGIRGRYLDPSIEHKWYPVRILNGRQFNFLTNNSLYGLWFTKQAIMRHKKVVLGESEKYTLQCETYFGSDNFSCSLYGKAMSEIKKMLLLRLGIIEVIIALDFDYESVYDNEGNFTPEFEKFKKNVYRIGDYFKSFCKVTALISYGGHKVNDSPTDNGKEWYKGLYDKREELY